MSKLQLLVLGTSNRKKAQELAVHLAPLGLELRTLAEFHQALSVAEEADSFEANARAKAVEQARHLKQWVLGEDSGLVVDALDGAPGVRSARFAGPGADDAANNRRLLEALAGTVRATSCGTCRGRIIEQPRGNEGFGYDPLFEIPEYHRTMAELGIPVKRWLSHRGRAARALIPQLRRLM